MKCEKQKKGHDMRKKWREIPRYVLFVFRIFCDKFIAGLRNKGNARQSEAPLTWIVWFAHQTTEIASCSPLTDPSAIDTSKVKLKKASKSILILVWTVRTIFPFPRHWDCLIQPLIVSPQMCSHLYVMFVAWPLLCPLST